MPLCPSIRGLQSLGRTSQASVGAEAIVPEDVDVLVSKKWLDELAVRESRSRWIEPLIALMTFGGGFAIGAWERSDGFFAGPRLYGEGFMETARSLQRKKERSYEPVSQRRLGEMIRAERGRPREYGSAADAVPSSPSSYRMTQR